MRKTLSIWWRRIWLHPAVISVMMTFVTNAPLLVTSCITSPETLQEMYEMANVWRGPPVLEALLEACLLHIKGMVLLHTTKPTPLLHPLKSHPRPEVASLQWNLMMEKTRGRTKRSAHRIHRRRLHMKPQARPFTAWRVADTTVAMLEIWCVAASATSGIMRTASPTPSNPLLTQVGGCVRCVASCRIPLQHWMTQSINCVGSLKAYQMKTLS